MADSTKPFTSPAPVSARRGRRSYEAGARLALVGVAVNFVLAAVKIFTGVIGNCYALIADGIESTLDIFGSLVIWFGLKVASAPPDTEHPYGHGKAEPLASVAVALAVIGAAVGLAIQSIREIVTPHHAPAAPEALVFRASPTPNHRNVLPAAQALSVRQRLRDRLRRFG